MLKTILQKTLDILSRPFRKHLLFLIAFFVLGTGPYFLWNIFYQKVYFYGFLMAIHCFMIAYAVTLLVGLIKPDIVRKVVQWILLVVAAIGFAVNFYCIFEMGYLLDADLLTLIMGTDINETKEFASVMLPKWIIAAVLGVYLVFLALWAWSRRHKFNLGKKMSLLALVGTCLCLAVTIKTWVMWEEGPIHRIYEMTQYQIADDLKPYYTHPAITVQDSTLLPTNVVLIIGESFARSHSSLYGYEKDTNPCLKAYRDNSLLFTLDSIDSPAPTTAESLRLMLSTYSIADDTPSNDKEWYKYPAIIELMEDCGYDSYWFGNQARGSKKNGAARVFAEACHTHKFLQQEGADRFNKRTDQVLVDSSYQYAQPAGSPKRRFMIYHMMGSHFDYEMRYPKEYARFTEKDYAAEPLNHRSTLATYDNSILYNDYIVGKIMELFKDQDALVIYLPDHGQVMFRDPKSPDYFSHGKQHVPHSYALGVEIPLMIYASPLYQEKHPQVIQRLKARQDSPKSWNGDDLPYLILDLIGVTSVGTQSIQPKSAL